MHAFFPYSPPPPAWPNVRGQRTARPWHHAMTARLPDARLSLSLTDTALLATKSAFCLKLPLWRPCGILLYRFVACPCGRWCGASGRCHEAGVTDGLLCDATVCLEPTGVCGATDVVCDKLRTNAVVLPYLSRCSTGAGHRRARAA